MRIALAMSAALLLTACGSSFTPGDSGRSGRQAAPLASIYDADVRIPDLSFPLLGAIGLRVDLTVEIQPFSGASFQATVLVRGVEVGGAARPWSPASPLPAAGLLQGSDWTLDSFGPIEVGSAATGITSVMISLAGSLSADGRALDGVAVATSSGEVGEFHAIKQRRYLVAGTDFGVTGTVSLIRVRYGTTFEVLRDLEAISGDPVARATGGAAYVVNRLLFDNVQALDPADSFRTALQFTTGDASNPHDALAVDPNRLYVTRYEPPYNDILIAARADGAPLGFIDLSPHADNSSGTPRADGLALAEGLVFVGLQNIDASFHEFGPGKAAVIDPDTDAVVRVITLEGRNPFGPPAVHPVTGRLYWAAAGIFQGSLPRDLSGGVEVIDPVSIATMGLLVDDDDLGGNVSGVALTQAGSAVRGYCVVTLGSGDNVLAAFDADTGAVLPGEVFRSRSFLPEVVSDGDGYVLLPVHDFGDPRLVVLDGATGLVVATLRMSLPPFSVAVLTRPLGS